MVPGAGIEPALPCGNEILSLACLPISPPGLVKRKYSEISMAYRDFSEVGKELILEYPLG